MKINHIYIILMIIFLTIVSGCGGGPPGPSKEQIDADNAIKDLENQIPTVEENINSLKNETINAKSKGINLNDVENIIQDVQPKLSEIKSDLDNARSYFNSQNYVLSNQTAQDAKNKLENYLKYEYNLAADKLRGAVLNFDIQQSEKTLLYLKNQSQSFKEKVSAADNDGVDIKSISMYTRGSDQYISSAEESLNTAKSELDNKNYDNVIVEVNKTTNEFNQIQNYINQGLKKLEDEYNRAIQLSKELLSKADYDVRKTEIYLVDAQNNGVDISKFKDRYEQTRSISTEAIDAFSSRKFKIVKLKTEAIIKSISEIDNEVLDMKYDILSKNIIQRTSKNIKGNDSINYIKIAEESRSNKKYEESLLFVNKAIISTGFFIVEDTIFELEKISNNNQLNLNLENTKRSIIDAKTELNKGEIENSLNSIRQTNILVKELADNINNYIDAKVKIQKVKDLSFLWISSNTSEAEKYLNKSLENIKKNNFEESIKLSNMAIESAKKEENEILKKINNNLFLIVIKKIKDIVSTTEKDGKIKIYDISNLKLENTEFKPPEINIEMKSFNSDTSSINFQNISFTQPSISGSNINKMGKISGKVENIDCSNIKLGTSSYAYITVYNDGEETITNAYVDMLLGRDFGWPAGYREQSQRFQFSDIIEAKVNRRLVGQLNIPTEQSGYSLEGWYNARIMIFVNNKNIYTKDGSIYLSAGGSQCQFN